MIVLVHGVSETAAFGDPLRAHLPADTLTVQLPDLRCPDRRISRQRPTPTPAG